MLGSHKAIHETPRSNLEAALGLRSGSAHERLHGRVAGFLDSMLDTEDSAEAEWNLDSLFSAMAVGGLLERL